MTAKYLLKCKRARTENCKGFKSDPIESYGKWAYWCGNELRPSWKNEGCQCEIATYARDMVSTEAYERKTVNELGIETFGSREATRAWMNESVFSLEGQRPIDVMRQENGVQRVKNIIIGIAGGMCA